MKVKMVKKNPQSKVIGKGKLVPKPKAQLKKMKGKFYA